MTALEVLKMLRKLVIALLIWNVLITGILCYYVGVQNASNLDEQICNLEEIPMEELIND